MPYVLDASIAACWCYHDEEDERADAALELLQTDRALAPHHWWFEVGNMLIVGERRRRIDEQPTAEFAEQLARSPIDFAPFPDRAAVLLVARVHSLTFYDAAYLELAKRESIPLATLDKDLADAARAEGVTLVGMR